MTGASTVRTTCPRDCYDRCGLLARVENGRVTAVGGDPASPLSRGRLCAKCRLAYNGVWLDGSARLGTPLRRTGPKGQGRFVAASWDEALDDIAAHLADIAGNHGPDKVLHTHYQGTYSAIACNFPERFFHRYGATEVDPGTICDRAGHVALEAMFGTSFEGFDPRTSAAASCLVLWGVNPSHSGPLTDRDWVRRFAGRTIVVDPVRTRTAEAADLHLQPLPGTDIALALGLLALLAAHGGLDRDFLARHVRGWSAVAASLDATAPADCARECGVELAAMDEAARLIGAGPTLFWLGIGLQRQAQGGDAVRAVSLLPVATGNLGRPGAGLLYMNGYSTRGIAQRDLQRIASVTREPPRISHMDLADTLGDARRARALFNWNTNVAASAVDQRRLHRAVAREDLFTVAIDLFRTDTCEFADWVLPAASFLEFDDLVLSYFQDSLSAQVRAQAPFGESLPNQEIFRRLAARMGYTEPELFEDDASLIARMLRATGTGLDFAALAARGTVLVGDSPRQQFAGLRFDTPSGAIEIDAAAFVSAGLGPVPVSRARAAPAGALRLLSPAAFWLMNSSYGNDPRIRAQLGESSILLHADDAAARGILDGGAGPGRGGRGMPARGNLRPGAPGGRRQLQVTMATIRARRPQPERAESGLARRPRRQHRRQQPGRHRRARGRLRCRGRQSRRRRPAHRPHRIAYTAAGKADGAAMRDPFDLDEPVYDWCLRLHAEAGRHLGVRSVLHHVPEQVAQADIFVFNRLARGPSFLPQYFVFDACGARCRSVVAGAAFRGDARRARLLRELGAVPDDQPGLATLLALDLLKGRRIVFSAGEAAGPDAVDLAQGLAVFLAAVRRRMAGGDTAGLEHWVDTLGLPSLQRLRERAARPVTVAPAHITCHPRHVAHDVPWHLAARLAGRHSTLDTGAVTDDAALFLGATGLDVRLGEPLRVETAWRWAEHRAAAVLARELPAPGAAFAPEYRTRSALRRWAARRLDAAGRGLRERIADEIRRGATVGASQLAARLLLLARERGSHLMERARLARLVYLAAKKLQAQAGVHLHQDLRDPQRYRPLADGESSALDALLEAAAAGGDLALDGTWIRLAGRQDAPVLADVAAAIAPLPDVEQAVRAAWDAHDALTPQAQGALAFDDLRAEHAWDRRQFSRPAHRAINARESATADASPFLLHPARPRAVGVLLAHGFLSSPAEMRPLAERLRQADFRVLGVRLKGHGTSPWDLRERCWQDWLASVAQGYATLGAWCDRICVVGFSTGAALALAHAATRPAGLRGVVACSTPIHFRNSQMRYVPLVHGANRLVAWASSGEGPMPFRRNDPEHPDINYRHMPLRGLHELTRMVGHVRDCLPDVRCPALILQATEDHVVDPRSAQHVYEHIGSRDKTLHWIASRRHGIVHGDIGDTHARIVEFAQRL